MGVFDKGKAVLKTLNFCGLQVRLIIRFLFFRIYGILGKNPHGCGDGLLLLFKQASDFSKNFFYVFDAWDEFEAEDAPSMDFVFTVCDNAANEPCPVWPGRPVTAHWGLAAPAGVEGTETEQLKAFERAYDLLKERIAAFLALPFDSLDSVELRERLEKIGSRVSGTDGE